MFGWIANLFNRVTGSVGAAVAAVVHDVISILYGFLHSLFGIVIRAWDELWRGIRDFVDHVEQFFISVGHAFYNLYKIWIPNFLKWINLHIIAPLLTATKWILHEGTLVYYYITHPTKLVELIWNALLAKLETSIQDTSKKLGSFVLSWIAHHLKDFTLLIEDIIHAVL